MKGGSLLFSNLRNVPLPVSLILTLRYIDKTARIKAVQRCGIHAKSGFPEHYIYKARRRKPRSESFNRQAAIEPQIVVKPLFSDERKPWVKNNTFDNYAKG